MQREEETTGVTMQGIQFVTNDKGEKVAVQIDLRKHAAVWEDVYDSITARNRSREPRESIESVKERLINRRKLNG
jgi:ribosomal protein L20A (L18A)